MEGPGTREQPWALNTPSGGSEFQAFRDEALDPPAMVVEVWGRSPDNPVGGWYGLKKGLRGRFAMYVPPVMEAMGLAEVEHQSRNNRMRAL
jgi:hypothetical protein